MLRADFNSRPLVADGDLDAIAMPLAGPGPGAFSGLFGELQAEVAEFIENGSGSGPASLSAEGRFHHLRLQSVPAVAAGGLDDAQQDFAAAVAPWAREAAQRLGVSADILTAHAALESGWGQRPLRRPDGSDSHNLFGIKAGGGWSGAAIDAPTTEYGNGMAQGRVERFRSYPDTGSAFRDFTRVLLDNPRYQGALNAGNDARAYAQGLVRGGYATDPTYADKLVRVAARFQSGD